MANIQIESTVISVDGEVMSGSPVFNGTRVPIRTLFDCLEGGHSIDLFLSDFPSVTNKQAHQVLKDASESLQKIADSRSHR